MCHLPSSGASSISARRTHLHSLPDSNHPAAATPTEIDDESFFDLARRSMLVFSENSGMLVYAVTSLIIIIIIYSKRKSKVWNLEGCGLRER